MQGTLISALWGAGVRGNWHKRWCADIKGRKVHITHIFNPEVGGKVTVVPCDNSCVKTEKIPPEVSKMIRNLI